MFVCIYLSVSTSSSASITFSTLLQVSIISCTSWPILHSKLLLYVQYLELCQTTWCLCRAPNNLVLLRFSDQAHLTDGRSREYTYYIKLLQYNTTSIIVFATTFSVVNATHS